MVTIEEARAQLQEQRGLVATKKQEIAEAQKKLQEARAKLPQLTQRRLRQGIFAGLKGRQARKVVAKAESDISGQEALLEGYEGQITGVEGELGGYETQILDAERQVAEAEAEQFAFQQARKFWEDRIPVNFVTGRERDYLEQFYEDEAIAQSSFANYVSQFEKANPTEKLIVDWKNMRVKGVDSGALGQSFSADEYNKKIQEINKQLQGITSGTELQDVGKTFGRTERTQDIPKLEGFGKDVFPRLSTGTGLVSAYSEPMSYLTTGSPIRYEQIPMSVMPPKQNILQKGISWLGSDLNIPLFTIAGGGGSISTRQISEFAREYGAPGKTLSLFIPQTKAELGLMAGVGYLGAGSGFIGSATRTGIGVLGGMSAINPNLPPEERFAGGLMALGSGFRPAIREIPREITIPLRETRTTFLEVQRPVEFSGKSNILSSYNIQREITPPKVTMGGPEGYLFSPLRYAPPRIETIKTPSPVLADQPFFVFSRTGKGLTGDINILSGKSEIVVPTSKAEFSQLSKNQQFLFQRIAEDITGRPVSLERVPSILAKNPEYAQSYIQQYGLGTYAYKKPTITATLFEKAMQGKATTRYLTSSEFSKTGETPLYDVYEGSIFFKDVTKPFARATGKTPKMTGKIIKIREPIVLGEDTGVQVFMGGGKKSSPQYLKQLYQEKVVPTAKPFIKLRAKTIKLKGGLKQDGTTLYSRGMVGLYSRSAVRPDSFSSDFDTYFGKAVFTKSAQAQTDFGLSQTTGQDLQYLWTQGQVSGLEILPRQRFRQPQLELYKQQQKELQKLSPFEKAILKVGQIPKQALKERQALKEIHLLKQVQRQPSPFFPRPTSKRPPKQPPKRLRLRGKPTRERYAEQRRESPFKLYFRRFGKFFEAGKGKTYGEVFERGLGLSRKTLGASFFVEKGGRKIQPKSYPLGFRPAKKEPSVVVQRRGFRLGTQSERREIQSARRIRRKSAFWK